MLLVLSNEEHKKTEKETEKVRICKISSSFFRHQTETEKDKLQSFAIKGQSHPAIWEGYAPLVLN